MTSVEAGRLAAKAGVNTLLLSHLPHFGDIRLLKNEAETMFSGKVLLADLGMQVEL
ncbi:hypothetical protein D3C85_1855190 [compost metagenome]